MRITPSRPIRIFPLVLILGCAILPEAAPAVPPVPGKQGYAGPREGFSTAHLRSDFAQLPQGGQRITVETQATYRVLALRVSFSDTPIESSAAYYNRVLFFMNQYWNQVSGGLVTLQPTLWDSVFTLPQTMAYYGDDARFQERVVYMVRDLVALADSTIDFRPYQSIVIFHAGQGQEADVLDNSRDQLWSAFLTPQDFSTVLPDSTGAVGIRTNDLISPGNPYRVKEVVELPESESQDGEVFGTTGVTCHEFGHQLGLPDLYDTTPELNGYSQGLGSWDIMATGVWNANGFVPASPSAWSRSYLNWIVPTRIATDQSVTLAQIEQPVGANPRIVQIPVTQSEYFLLENRRQDLNDNGMFDFDDTNGDGSFDFYADSYAGAEFDFFLPGDGTGSGVLAYHVDDSKIAASLLYNTVNGDRDRKAIDLIEADGIEDLDEPPSGFNSGSPDDVFRAGWRDKWTPDTTPSTEAYGHIRTGISVQNISAPASLMTFDVAFDRLKPGWPVVLGGRVRNGGVPPLATDLNGDQKLELIIPVQRLNNTGSVYVLEPDGTDFRDLDANPGTRDVFLATSSAVTASPCVGDIDGDGVSEIILSTLTGTIYALHADRTEVLDGDGDPTTLGVFVTGGQGGGQPILVDLDGDGAMEIVAGQPANPLGGSSLTAYRVSSGVVQVYSLPMGGSTAAPAGAADFNGDGLPEVIMAAVATTPGDLSTVGLFMANWEILNDPFLPTDPDEFPFRVRSPVGAASAPVITDINRDGTPDIVVSDRNGAIHALSVRIGPHIQGDLPISYTTIAELPGWPTARLDRGGISEVSLGDLERDGYPEAFHMGGSCLVAAAHYSGSPRSGFPIAAQDALAPADSTGFYPPIIADVDGDGALDVIPILPDGTRPAFRADGQRIPGFGEFGSTGRGAPPMLLDMDGDGSLEWVEVFDQVPLDPRVQINVRTTGIPASGAASGWSQYRYGPTRDGFFPTGPAGGSAGTSILSEVYAYPNPSRSGITNIHYRLSGPARAARLTIMDTAGNKVAEPPVGPAGLLGSSEHSVPWNHDSTASGVYLCRVEVESAGGTEVKFTKLAVIR